MLVMTTLFLNTSASLPRTSYFKMIDIWMVFGLLLPFFEVVLHTVTEYQRREVEDEVITNNDDPEGEAVLKRNVRKNGGVDEADEAEKDKLLSPCNNHHHHRQSNVAVVVVEEQEGVKMHRQLSQWLRSRRPTFFSLTVHFSRTIVPLIVLCFNIIYWTIAFLHN